VMERVKKLEILRGTKQDPSLFVCYTFAEPKICH
jgi:hypothetical protein